MSHSPRTFAIGDIHGDHAALETLLSRLPEMSATDTVVFIGDYVDRGPDSKSVIERVQKFQAECAAKVVTLRGNHEDLWLKSWESPDMGFLLPRGNGCLEMCRDYLGLPPLPLTEEPSADQIRTLLEVRSWLPESVIQWMRSLATWYEDEHAISVHAGLDGEGTEWMHPRDGRVTPLLWMREPDFYAGYHGKRVVFGHTCTRDLPTEHLGTIRKFFDDPGDIWVRGDLVGIDTACGKGGFLSAIELPRGKVYESR